MFITDLDADHLRQALTESVTAHGLEGPSLRALARVAGVSPSTLLNRFGSKSALHARVLDVLTERSTERFYRGLFPDDIVAGASAAASYRAESQRADLRLRLAFDELARSDDAVADVFVRTLYVERDAIRWAIARALGAAAADLAPSGEAVDLLHAVVTGLWARMCDRHEPMSGRRAGELWSLALAAVPRAHTAAP